jgi:hypothetical protein
MCDFKFRVSSCGYYTATLWSLYNDAKKIKTPYSLNSSSEDANTIGGLCDLEGYNKKAGDKCDSLGEFCLAVVLRNFFDIC